MLLPLSEILLPILCMANQPLLMLRSQFRGLFTLTPQIWVMAPARYSGAPPIFPLIALTRLHHNPHWNVSFSKAVTHLFSSLFYFYCI